MKALLVLIAITLMVMCSCEKKDKNLILPNKSLGNVKLGANRVSEQQTDSGLMIFSDHTSQVFAIYTRRKNYTFRNGQSPIGTNLEEIQKVFGEGKRDLYEMHFDGDDMFLFNGVFVSVDKNNLVTGIGVWDGKGF